MKRSGVGNKMEMKNGNKRLKLILRNFRDAETKNERFTSVWRRPASVGWGTGRSGIRARCKGRRKKGEQLGILTSFYALLLRLSQVQQPGISLSPQTFVNRHRADERGFRPVVDMGPSVMGPRLEARMDGVRNHIWAKS